MAVALLCVLGAAGLTDADRESVRRGADWLWAQQGEDGGWHSATYGLLRSGQSLTPFVLHALLQVPADARSRDDAAVERAVAFLRSHTTDVGAVGMSDPDVLDYPCYATSLAVRAFLESGRREEETRMVGWLRGQQFAEERGWAPAMAPYGAWGMGGPPRRPPDPGHVDLSMTRHVLEALAEAGAAQDDPAWERALVYLGRLQGDDGGFHFSTTEPDANKAGEGRSYGTATADGILALLAAGVPPEDERVRRAAEWLVTHHRVDRVPGIGEDESWGEAMWAYYAAASAAALARVSPDGDWRGPLRDEIRRRQREDGSWCNANSRMKEDDPLISTPFAIVALTR